MRYTVLLVVALAVGPLSACMTMAPTSTHPGKLPIVFGVLSHACNPSCAISVVVEQNEDRTWCRPKMVLPILTAGDNGEVTITWRIEDQPYVFSKESYKFALFVKGDPGAKFNKAQVKSNGKVLELKFKHQKNVDDPPEIYSYALTVREEGDDGHGNDTGQFCETLDPWLIS